MLDAKGLALSFFNRLWEVCSLWQKQVPPPARAPPRQWLVSIHAIRNTRRRMEDRHVCLPAFNQLFGLSVSAPPPGPQGGPRGPGPESGQPRRACTGAEGGKPLQVPSRPSHRSRGRNDAYSFHLQAEGWTPPLSA